MTNVVGVRSGGGAYLPATLEPQIQVTLDFMLKPAGPAPGTSSSAIGSGAGGTATVYVDNGGNAVIISTIPTLELVMPVSTYQDTYAIFNALVYGTASTALTMEMDVMVNTGSGYTVIRTLKQQMPAGINTWSPTFMITVLPSGIDTIGLRLSVSTGQFNIAGTPDLGDLEMWIQGPNIQGGVGGAEPEIDIIDTIGVNGSEWLNVTTAAATSGTLARSTPLSAGHPISVFGTAGSEYMNVTDANTDGQQSTLWTGYSIGVAVGADDGHSSTGPSFTTSSNQLEAGNDGSFIWDFFMRFVLPAPGIPAGATITRAFFTAESYATNVGFIGQISAEHSASPTAPTSRTDLEGRTLTTARVAWASSQTVNTMINSPSLVSIIQELVNAFGNTMTAINIFVRDNGSPINGEMILDSFENNAPSNTPVPVLVVMWHL